MASTQDPGELHEGRDGQRELYRLVNWLRRRVGSMAADADYWTSSDQTALLPSSVNLGALSSGILQHTVAAGVSTPGVVTVGAGLTYASPTLDRAALTGDITAAAGSNTTSFRSFAATSVLGTTFAAGVPTEISAVFNGDVLRLTGGVLGFGSLGASSIPALDATFITQTPNANLANEQALSALASGVLSSVTATGVVSSTAFTATRIPFGSGTNGLLTESTNFTYDDATGTLLVGLTSGSAVVGVTMEVFRNQNAGTQFVFANSSAGASAYAAFQVGQSSNLATGATFGMVMYGSGSAFFNPILASTGSLELSGGSGNMSFWIIQAAGDFIWHTGTAYPNPTPKMKLSNAGTFTAYADAIIGLSADVGTSLQVGTTIKVGNAGAFPANSFAQFHRTTNGASYAIVSNASAGTAAEAGLILSQSATSYTNYMQMSMLGSGFTTLGPFQASGAAFEHVTNTTAPMFFSAYGSQAIDFYTTTSRTLRMRIENDGDVSIGGGLFYDNARDTLCLGVGIGVVGQRLSVLGTRTIASDANVTWDPVYIDPGTLSLTGTTDVTIARGLAAVFIRTPTISGSASINVDVASTVVIESQPALSGVTATVRYALRVLGGDVSLEGNFLYVPRVEASLYVNATNIIAHGTGGTRTFDADASTNKIAFFGVSLASQQAGGAATAGAAYGATEQGMLNAAYQAMRAYGLLT